MYRGPITTDSVGVDQLDQLKTYLAILSRPVPSAAMRQKKMDATRAVIVRPAFRKASVSSFKVLQVRSPPKHRLAHAVRPRAICSYHDEWISLAVREDRFDRQISPQNLLTFLEVATIFWRIGDAKDEAISKLLVRGGFCSPSLPIVRLSVL